MSGQRAARWLGDAWLCPDCGKVLRRPPWLLDGDRLHSAHCPTAMVRVSISLLAAASEEKR